MSADFWAGYVSGAAGILIGNPLDIIKVRLQAGTYSGSSLSDLSLSLPSSSSSSSSPLSSVLLGRTATLATGAAAPILGYGALNALLFVSYRRAEELLQPGSRAGPDLSSSLATTWLAGAVAGLATWVVSTPTELIKCRAQTAVSLSSSPRIASSPSSPPSSPSSWAIARQIWAANGLRGFFLGGSVTALRDSIGYGFYFWSYRLATDAWRQRWPSDNDNSTNSQAAALFCGGLAGIITWASVFPLDVIKTRVQSHTSASSPLLSSSSPPRLSTLQITRLAYRQGGLAVFFRGLGICSARAFVVNAVQWAVYEWIMRELGAQPGLHEEGVAL